MTGQTRTARKSNPPGLRLRRVAALLAILCLPLGSARGQGLVDCGAVYDSDRTEIDNQALATNNYNISRGAGDYETQLRYEDGRSFMNALLRLPAGSRWVDMGAGKARALVQGLRMSPWISEGIAIAYRKPPDAQDSKAGDRLRYLEGDYVENMARDGRLDGLMNQVDLVTDVYGPLSFSENLPALLQVYLDLLRPGGSLLFNMMKSRGYPRGSEKAAGSPETVNAVAGYEAPEAEGLVAWLRTIPGIEVAVGPELVLGDREWGWEKSFSVRIVKTDPQVLVPRSLRIARYEPGSPPRRVFVRDGGPEPTAATLPAPRAARQGSPGFLDALLMRARFLLRAGRPGPSPIEAPAHAN